VSRRYGRNQRRAHRERIAELEAQVRRLLVTGPGDWRWAEAEPYAFTIDERYVLSSSDETLERFDDRTERRASITVILHGTLESALMRHGRINWRRMCWKAVAVGRFIQDHRGVCVEVSLEAVAPRDWSRADLPERLR
jgi:hypothetical protein